MMPLLCGSTTAFDIHTNRKLRYGLKDGAPDSATPMEGRIAWPARPDAPATCWCWPPRPRFAAFRAEARLKAGEAFR